MKIKHAVSDKEKNELDQLLRNILWKPLGLPRDIRHSFKLNNPQIELLLVSSPSWDSYQQVNFWSTKFFHCMESNFNACFLKLHKMTSDNSVFVVRYGYSNDFVAFKNSGMTMALKKLTTNLMIEDVNRTVEFYQEEFDNKILVKVNAAEVFEKELSRPGWKRDIVNLVSVCDSYQPEMSKHIYWSIDIDLK